MLKWKGWLLSLLVLALTAAPVMAGNKDAKTETENTANTTATEGSPSPSPSPSLGSSTATGDANVTALLGVLVMKGVLAPTEANAIKNATPTSQFQVLVDVLSRKGLLTAADLAAAASPAAQPSTHPAVPEAAISTSLASVETAALGASWLLHRRLPHLRSSRRSLRCACCRSIRPRKTA